MFYALNWFVVAALLALWSLTVWALHAAATWALANAGALTSGAAGAETLTLPAWLAPWLPPEIAQWATQWAAGLGPLVDGLMATVPALAGGLTLLSWVAWGLGSALLALIGVALHVLIAVLRRRGGQGPGPGARPLAAG